MIDRLAKYASEASPHIPVLLNEVIEVLSIKDGGVYVDATFGAGGYSSAILQEADCTLYAFDRDPNVIKNSQELIKKFDGRLKLIHGCFGDMERLLTENGVDKVDGIVFDIGVSSMQIDEAERGFSFSKDGALDMRMSADGLSAADVVNTFDETELANIIYKYGEERKSRWVAKAIVEARREKKFETTLELADLIRKVVRKSKDGIDPATRTFQALRIFVNDELGELERGLQSAENKLGDDGILAVVTFHSLEDRIVKKFINKKSGKTSNPSRYMPIANETVTATFEKTVKKPITASKSELKLNPRSRSAKLRTAKKINSDKKRG
jgi:16S rRNA (cytosine1402-N4)-methyltransferase